MAIQNRRGQAVDFVPSKMLPGEFAVSLDNRKLYMCFASGTVKEVALTDDVTQAISAASTSLGGRIAVLESASTEQGATLLALVTRMGTAEAAIRSHDGRLVVLENDGTNIKARLSDVESETATLDELLTDLNLNMITISNDVEGLKSNAVRFDTVQNKSAAQKLQARENTDSAGIASLATAYSPSARYAVGDMVTYDGKLYTCKTAITTAEAWNSSHWTEVTVGDQLSNLKDDFHDSGIGDYYRTSFEWPASSGHSSSLNKIAVDIKSGTKINLCATFSKTSTHSVVWVLTKSDGTTTTLWSTVSGVKRSYVLTYDIIGVSVYFDSLPEANTVSIYVSVDGYLVETIDDLVTTTNKLNTLKSYATGTITFDYNTSTNVVSINPGHIYDNASGSVISFSNPISVHLDFTQSSCYSVVLDVANNTFVALPYTEYRFTSCFDYPLVGVISSTGTVTSALTHTVNGYYDGIESVIEDLELIESRIDDAQSKIGTVYSTSFETSGSHSSNADTIATNIPSGSEIDLLVSFLNGDNVSLTWILTNSDSTTTQLSGESGTARKMIVSKDVVKIGVYFGALSGQTTATINVKVYGDIDYLQAYSQDKIGTVYSTSFETTGSHSTNANVIITNIPTGSEIGLLVDFLSNETVSLSWILTHLDSTTTQISGESETLKKVIVSKDVVKVGVYFGALSGRTTATVSVKVYGDIDYLHEYIDEKSYLGVVPDYWISNLNSSIDKVALLQSYSNGVSFGFITDIHWETNWQKSPALIKYIADNSRIDMWINGGDTDSGSGNDVTIIKKRLFNTIGKYSGDFRFYSINGNHDNNGVGGTTVLTSSELRNIMLPFGNDIHYGNGNYYWFDYRGTRFVCLDTGMTGSSDNTQISWASNVISSSELPVIVAMHIIKVSQSETNPCAMFNDLINAIGENADGKVKMIIGGHTHIDLNFIASNGIPVVALDTDSRFSDDGITRTSGTISEQCLSIVTIDYDAKTINVTRIGSIGSDFSVSY